MKVTRNSSVHTYQPFPHYQVDNGTVEKYYFFGGQRIAMLEGSTFTYLHSDHLRSPVLTTSGTISATQTYRAYGLARSSTGTLPTRYQFTGQYQDDSGLTFMNARYYDPSIGTFISADTIVPEPGIVADYNRYAYVRGRVMNATDPSGHFTDDDIAYLCPGCETWDDVRDHYGAEIYALLRNESVSWGSLLYTGNGDTVTGMYTLVLEGHADDLKQDVLYSIGVWDVAHNKRSSLAEVFSGSNERIAAFGTNLESINDPGYFFAGYDRGFDNQGEIESWARPPYKNFGEVASMISPNPSEAGFYPYNDINGRFYASAFLTFGGRAVADMTVSLVDIYYNIRDDDRPNWDAVYPTIRYSSKSIHHSQNCPFGVCESFIPPRPQ